MTVTAAVLDYEAGNLRSAEKSLQRVGFETVVTADADRAAEADLVVVPGVGHFGQCVRRFDDAGFAPLIRARVAAEQPVLGICVGMQIMYEGSDEDPGVPGFGFLPGWVRRIPSATPDGTAVLDVNGREQGEGHQEGTFVDRAETSSWRLASSCRPTSADFSGWNWVPTTLPSRAIAGRGTP